MSKKKLYRSTQNKVICGLLGGIGEYLDIDPAILRVGFIIVAFLTALMPCIIAYFISCLVVPKAPSSKARLKKK